MLVLHVFNRRGRFRRRFGQLGLRTHLHRGQGLGDLQFDAFEHACKQLERLALVFLLRVLLRVAAQVYALAQMIERGQVLAPMLIQAGEHDPTLVLVQGLGGREREFLAVQAIGFGHRLFKQRLIVQVGVRLQPGFERDRKLQFRRVGFLQAGHVPLFLHALRRNVGAEDIAHHALAQRGDGFADVGALEQLVSLLVDDLALVVGDVVVLQQLLPDVEVVRLDLALCRLDRARHPGALDRLAFGHFQPLHDRLHLVAGKNAQQRIFQRQVEARGAGIALAAGAAAQLVVDAARLVALGADDMQAAGGNDLGVQLLPFLPQRVDAPLLLRFVHALGGAQHVNRLLDVAAKHDVGAAAGHIGGDGHHLRLARLSHDFGLARMLLGVEYLVRQLVFLQHAREQL